MRTALLFFKLSCLPVLCFSQNIDKEIISVNDPDKTFVTVISVEDYQTGQKDYVENVTHAMLEGERFMLKLTNGYNVPKRNISYYGNANLTQIKLLVTKVSKLAKKYPNKSEIIIFFTGRYTLNPSETDYFLLPAGTSEKDLNYAIGLEYIYQKLEESNARKITILLDAEPAGWDRKESLLKDGGQVIDIKNKKIAPKTTVRIASMVKKEYFDVATPVDNKDTEIISTAKTDEDTQPPVIEILTPDISEPVSLAGHSLFIKGSAHDNSGIYVVSVNGEEAHLSKKGDFQANVVLNEGLNDVYIQAIDINKNITTEKISATCKIKETQKTVENVSGETNTIQEENRGISYYALLVGVNDYNDPLMTNLDGPLNDVDRLYNILKDQYIFPENNITILRNPTRAEIIEKLDKLEKILTEKDNLLVFFAGHGYWDENVEKGYWLPTDALHSNTANWIRNSTISGYISGIKSKHTLLIADACFSGGIFKTRSVIKESPEAVQKLYNLSSRKAMTSGTLKEVPDKSVFVKYLVKKLTQNPEKYLSAEQLFFSFKPAVLNNSENIPQYGVIKNAGDEGGDFIFIRKE